MKGVEDDAQGYYVEIRPIENIEWSRCNANPVTLTSYTVLGLNAMACYWVRAIATNYGGDGEPQGFDTYVIAMPPPGKIICPHGASIPGYCRNTQRLLQLNAQYNTAQTIKKEIQEWEDDLKKDVRLTLLYSYENPNIYIPISALHSKAEV